MFQTKSSHFGSQLQQLGNTTSLFNNKTAAPGVALGDPKSGYLKDGKFYKDQTHSPKCSPQVIESPNQLPYAIPKDGETLEPNDTFYQSQNQNKMNTDQTNENEV